MFKNNHAKFSGIPIWNVGVVYTNFVMKYAKVEKDNKSFKNRSIKLLEWYESLPMDIWNQAKKFGGIHP